jgi:hypothetical protein
MAAPKFTGSTESTQTTAGEYVHVPVTDSRTAVRAATHMLLKHTADVFTTIVNALADHYKLDKDEMMEVITSDKRYTEMMVNPMIHDLGYLGAAAPAAAEPPAAAAAAAAPPAAAAPVIKKFKLKKKPATSTSSTASS